VEILMAVLVGVFFGVGIHLLQQRGVLRLALGVAMLGHGAHLALMTVAGLQRGAPPVVTPGVEAYADPLPQALVLTAIVIGFGVTAFLLALCYRTYQEFGTDDLSKLTEPDALLERQGHDADGEAP
jgi:multicomponent Na+:H+ antiporter subunit C